MKYQYHDLSNEQFEEIVIAICVELLGTGVQKFSTGKDGGRDARFHGRAQNFVSQNDLWDGLIVIQAKHTQAINEKFSDSDFFTNQSSVINKEITRIKNLLADDSLGYYILFSNRKLPAIANENILNHISSETGLDKRRIFLIGIEQMELYIKRYPIITSMVSINPFEMPLTLDPDDLAEIVLSFNKNREVFRNTNNDVNKGVSDIERVKFTKKNSKNNLSDEYAEIIEKEMALYYNDITNFLENPANIELKNKYADTVYDFNMGIISHKNEDEKFDKILNYIYTNLIGRDGDLKSEKRLTRIFLHYMYYFCDIGEV